ncbi:unnamed protein product [Leptosia nina]|uniref:Uncharacterized protein n=1 Tax=Leptosia nina TaxID=320188 RepID=A0AAV1JVE9_9NEOP
MDDLNNVKHDNRNDHIHPSAYGYNHYAVKYAHVSNKPHSKKTHEEIDLSGFQKYITQQVNDSYKDSNVYQSNLNNNISIWLQELTTALGGLKQLYGIEVTSTPTTTEQITKNVKEHFESEFYLGGTAEIETVLSEIKEKALQIMLQQIPSAADIISNAVTETTFDMASMISTPRSHGQHLNIPHNRNMRSIYYHAATLAHQLECDLQEKCKNAYYKMKHKISHDLEEEIIHSKNAIKEALNKLQKSQLHNTMKNKGIVDKTTLSTKMLPIVKTRESPNYKSQKKNPKKKLFTKRTTTVNKSKAHVIPKVTDDYSMLSVYEKLLLKSHDNDVMKQLTTHNVPMNDYKLEEKISKRNHESLENINLKRSVQKLYDDDQMPDVVDYNEENNATSDSGATRNVAISKKVHTSTNDEISYNTLSNKISYNDYVNGFKYYLNFQKDQENQNFSNLVRYQAHRHHSVDDVGKYILEKLPKLPTTRKKRYLFEQETLEDQDISTKSDDSWFKKHFYVFIDKDPPKKFHTAQTVSLKEDRTYATKNGYVDVNLVHKPTGVIKLKSNKDKGNKKRKYKNFFKKISFHSKNPKKYSKRNLPTRKRRSNPFKVLKDIVFRNRYTDSDNKVRKLFDYDIVASSFNPNCKYIDVNRNTQLPNIDAMLRQIPNITSNLESLLDYGYTRHYVSNNLPTRKYVHNKGLYYTKPGKYYVSNDKIDLTDKEMTAETQNYDYPNYYFNKSRVDDIINIRIKTADQINIKPLKTTKVTNIRYEATQNRMDPLLESLLGGQTPKTTKLLKTTQFPGYYLVSDGNLQISQSGRGKPVKEKAKNKKSYLEYNRPSIKVIDSLGKLYNYKVIHNGKEKEQYRRNENFISRASHKYHLSKTHNSEKKSKNIDKTVKPTTSDKKKVVDQSQNRNQVENMKQLNGNFIRKSLRRRLVHSKPRIITSSTPLPMSSNEFNKFLEENQIDVQSVTSPLPNFIPFSTQVPSNRVKPVHYGPEYRKQTTHNMKNTPSRSNGNFAYDYTYYPKEGKRKRRGNGRLLQSDDLFKGRGSNFQTFTAKDVAALEIIIDLRKHNQEYNEKETQNVSLDRNAKLIYEQDDKQKVTNSIQVHIALPDNADNFKRSPESVQVKKVFSAIMASPIDIAYQLHAFEKSTVLTPTTIGDSKLSPGLYLLVEKDNASYPEEQLILKPIKMKKNPSLSVQTAGNMSDFIDPTVDDVLDSTMTSEYENYVNGKSEHKRSISWDSIKKFFGHDRVCNCRCKANQTMCKACAASNAVITELIFEFDNLAKYMRDHCTEIQTFFWMNPTGGKKLREVVNKINKSLNDYYKRVKGKCQGRTCKMFSSGVDKRSSAQQFHKIRNKFEINTFLTALSKLSDDLDYVLTLGLLDEGIQNSGYLVQKIFDQCLSQSRSRRSFMDQHKKCKPSSSYSLENININLLCSSNTVKTTTSNYNHDMQDYTNRDNITPIKEIYSNYLDGKKLDQRNEKKKTLKDFIKRRFKQKQSQIFSAKHVQPRYKRKTFSKPIVNVLLLNNRSNKTKTELNTKLLKHQSTREIKEMEKTNDKS